MNIFANRMRAQFERHAMMAQDRLDMPAFMVILGHNLTTFLDCMMPIGMRQDPPDCPNVGVEVWGYNLIR